MKKKKPTTIETSKNGKWINHFNIAEIIDINWQTSHYSESTLWQQFIQYLLDC